MHNAPDLIISCHSLARLMCNIVTAPRQRPPPAFPPSCLAYADWSIVVSFVAMNACSQSVCIHFQLSLSRQPARRTLRLIFHSLLQLVYAALASGNGCIWTKWETCFAFDEALWSFIVYKEVRTNFILALRNFQLPINRPCAFHTSFIKLKYTARFDCKY